MEIVVANRRRKLSKFQGYRWVLENRLIGDVDQLRQIARKQTLALLDYETNADPDDVSSPLSHAALVKSYLEDAWPE